MRTEYYVNKLADSQIDDDPTTRVTTFEITFPRLIAEELLTHRMMSRNAASSRAIPNRTIIFSVTYCPATFYPNRPGMVADLEHPFTGPRAFLSRCAWEWGRLNARLSSRALAALGVHKQHANRPLAPYQWQTYVITSNKFGWENLFKQRCTTNAQPEFIKLANMIKNSYETGPGAKDNASLHAPFAPSFEEFVKNGENYYDETCDLSSLLLSRDQLSVSPARVQPGGVYNYLAFAASIAVARIARISYFKHGTNVINYANDLGLFRRLLTDNHPSPFDHVMFPRYVSSSDLSRVSPSELYPGWVTLRELLLPDFCQKSSITELNRSENNASQ